MRSGILLAIVAAASLARADSAGAQNWTEQSSGTTQHLRGVFAVSDSVVWASGAGGTFLVTVDGGRTWRASVVPGGEWLDFRDVHAFDERTAYLLAAGNGSASRIYKTTDGGDSWTLLYTNPEPAGFFDAMEFWDAEHGVVMGDPVDGVFWVMLTDDGGASWRRVGETSLPRALQGEAAFAASGTCLAIRGDTIWFGTGGAALARVFRSTDRGATWRVYDTPIAAGRSSAGIFSLLFRDARTGVAVGGDFLEPRRGGLNAAITWDGGISWRALPSLRGYRSAVTPVPDADVLVAVGLTGSDIRPEGGVWSLLDELSWNAVAFASPTAGWVVGNGGRIARFSGRLPGAGAR
jgi:photosystem II stability/assembly factor-like uncharacterized protein